MRRASSAYQRNWSHERPHSRSACAIGLPVSVEIIRAASSLRRIISSAMACSASARSKADLRPPGGQAARRRPRSRPRYPPPVATGASPSGFSVTGLMTGARAAARRATPAPVDEQSIVLIHRSSNLADLHDPPLGRRLQRRLSEDQRLASIFEANLGSYALLDRLHEGTDFGVEGLSVALGEEVEIGRPPSRCGLRRSE